MQELPFEAQGLLEDFLQVLHARYVKRLTQVSAPLADDPVVGILSTTQNYSTKVKAVLGGVYEARDVARSGE